MQPEQLNRVHSFGVIKFIGFMMLVVLAMSLAFPAAAMTEQELIDSSVSLFAMIQPFIPSWVGTVLMVMGGLSYFVMPFVPPRFKQKLPRVILVTLNVLAGNYGHARNKDEDQIIQHKRKIRAEIQSDSADPDISLGNAGIKLRDGNTSSNSK
jgi:hypothetical protein